MSSKPLRFYSLKELKSMPMPDDQYLIDGFLWERDHVILLAKDKVGKSIFAMQMACALSSGNPFLGEYNVFEPMQVCYIQTEGKQHEIAQRFWSMTKKHGVAAGEDNLHVLCTHSWQLDRDDGYQEMTELIMGHHLNPKVIFLDPLYMSMSGGLSDDLASRNMARNIRRLGEEFNAAVIVIHHEHKPRRDDGGGLINEGDGAIMGSFVWKAFPDHVLHIQRRPDGIRTVSCTTQRNARVVHDMQMELVSDPLHFKIIGSNDHPPYVDTIADLVGRNTGLSAQDLQVASGLALPTVKKALAYLMKPNVNKIKRLNPGERPVYYVLETYEDPIDKYMEAREKQGGSNGLAE